MTPVFVLNATSWAVVFASTEVNTIACMQSVLGNNIGVVDSELSLFIQGWVIRCLYKITNHNAYSVLFICGSNSFRSNYFSSLKYMNSKLTVSIIVNKVNVLTDFLFYKKKCCSDRRGFSKRGFLHIHNWTEAKIGGNSISACW